MKQISNEELPDGSNAETVKLMQDQFVAHFKHMGVLNKRGDKRGIVVDAPTSRVLYEAYKIAFRVGQTVYEGMQASQKHLPSWSTITKHQREFDPFVPGIQHNMLLAAQIQVRKSGVSPQTCESMTLVFDECKIVESVIYQNGKVIGFSDEANHQLKVLHEQAVLDQRASVHDPTQKGFLDDVHKRMESHITKNVMHVKLITNAGTMMSVGAFTSHTTNYVSSISYCNWLLRLAMPYLV